MSKLDDINYATYTGSRPQREDGSYISITPETRQEIKDVFLGIVPMPNHRDDCPTTIDHMMQRGQYKDPIDCFEDRCTCGAVELREIRERINEL